jgi:hypothetical protein
MKRRVVAALGGLVIAGGGQLAQPRAALKLPLILALCWTEATRGPHRERGCARTAWRTGVRGALPDPELACGCRARTEAQPATR